MIKTVKLSKRSVKDLKGLPVHIVKKFTKWIADVENSGVEEVRKVASWHDEPLVGNRAGQRSIRLSKAYRAIYEVKAEKDSSRVTVEFIEVQEVNKHDY